MKGQYSPQEKRRLTDTKHHPMLEQVIRCTATPQDNTDTWGARGNGQCLSAVIKGCPQGPLTAVATEPQCSMSKTGELLHTQGSGYKKLCTPQAFTEYVP